jgi:hypothetical protein
MGYMGKSQFMALSELGFIMDQHVWKLDFPNNIGGNLSRRIPMKPVQRFWRYMENSI